MRFDFYKSGAVFTNLWWILSVTGIFLIQLINVLNIIDRVILFDILDYNM